MHKVTILIAIGVLVAVASFSLLKFRASLQKESVVVAVANEKSVELPEKLAVQEKPEIPVRIFFVGDVMLGRYVGRLMEKEGFDYPYQKLGDVFADQDLVVGNLEGPVIAKYNYRAENQYQLSMSPDSLSAFKKAGFGLVSIGNNHGRDYGRSGADETRTHLSENNILFAGDAMSISSTTSIVRRIVRDRDISFISANATFPSFVEKNLLDLVGREKAERPHNFVIVAMHWGDEYKLVANENQQKIARDVIDVGADLMIGHHPHVVENIEKYKGKMIFYSLGNFIFDQYFSKDVQEELGVAMSITTTSTTFELIPFLSTRSQPSPMAGDEKTMWLEKLATRSEPELSSQIRAGLIAL